MLIFEPPSLPGLPSTTILIARSRGNPWQPKPAKRHEPEGEIDYRVGDVVICRASGAGFQAGRVYLVEAVLNRRAGRKVETTVTVRAGEQLIEIASPKAILGRTRLVAELSLRGQPPRSRCFANAAELQSWCDLNGVKREDVFARYIEL